MRQHAHPEVKLCHKLLTVFFLLYISKVLYPLIILGLYLYQEGINHSQRLSYMPYAFIRVSLAIIPIILLKKGCIIMFDVYQN